MYNIVIQHFCTLQNDNPGKSTYHLSPFKDNTLLLTVFPMLYTSSQWLIYFITGNLCLLISLTYFTNPPLHPSPLATTCMFSVSMTLFLFCYVCSLVLFFVFSAWLISLSIMPSRSIHVVKNGKTSFSLRFSNIPLCVGTTPSSSIRLLMVSGLLPRLGYCK